MIIRRWKFEDNLQISILEKQCFSNFWSFEMIADTFTQDNFIGFVALENNEIIGFIATKYCLDECELELIAVREDFRKQKVATTLLNEVEKTLKTKNVKKIFLEVRRSNETAQAFYEKNRFVFVDCRKNYYANVEDALIMCKIL